MKNNFLFTTALVAASMGLASIAKAEEGITVNDFVSSGNHDGAYYISGGEGTLLQDITVNGKTTLDYQTKLTGGKNLTVNGYLTQTQSGSDISGINVAVNNGALVLGNDLTVGDIIIGNGSDIALFVTDDEANLPPIGVEEGQYTPIGKYATEGAKTLNIANGKVLTFQGNNAIRESGESRNQTLTINGENGVVYFDGNNSEIALNSDVTINGKATLHRTTDLVGGKNLTINGYLTQTQSDSDISGVNVAVNKGAIQGTTAGALVLGNDLTVGDITLGDGVDVALWVSDDSAQNIGKYATEGAKTLNIAKGKVLTLEGNNKIRESGESRNQTLAINGTVKNNGTLTLNSNIILKNGSSYGFEVDNTGTGNAKIVLADGKTLTLEDNVKLDVNVSHVNSAKDYTFVEGGKVNGEWNTSGLTNNIYNVGVNDEQNTLTFKSKSAGEIASSIGADSNQAGTIAAVITDGDTANATFNSVAKAITSLAQTNPSAAIDAATALAPEVNPMVQQVQTSTLSQVFSAISSRMSGGSLASTGNGMSSGDNVFEKAAMWVKGLFNKSKLDTENGFDADSEGLAFGFEKNVNDDVKAGVAYAYTKTDVDGFMRTTDVDTHTLALYGEYKPSNWYVNGTMSYGWSDYSENKNVAGTNVNADYDAETFGLQAMAGYETEYKDYKVTPEAGLRYVHVKQDSYTDTAGQNISSDDLDVVTAVVGAKATRNWELENGTVLKPEVRAALTYDVIDADNSSVVTLANGSAYSVEGEGLDRLGFEFGAGISADVNEKLEITVGYEGKFREDYQDHTGMLNAKYKF